MCISRMIRDDLFNTVMVCVLLSGCSTPLKPSVNADDLREDAANVSSEDRDDAESGELPSQEELAQEAELAMNMFLRDQKVLFAKGQAEFEFGMLTSADTQKNYRLGETIVPTVSRYISIISARIRYAVTNNIEVSAKIPFAHVRTETDYAFLDPQDTLQDDSASGLGDIETLLRYQLFREAGYRPDIALSLSHKADTAESGLGSGDQSVGFGVTFVQTIDPAVFFLQTRYVYPFADDNVKRGSRYEIQLGSGFSLNDRVGYSIRYGISYLDSTELQDRRVRGTSQLNGNLIFGSTIQLSKNMFFEPSLSVGITDDASDAGFSFNLTF